MTTLEHLNRLFGQEQRDIDAAKEKASRPETIWKELPGTNNSKFLEQVRFLRTQQRQTMDNGPWTIRDPGRQEAAFKLLKIVNLALSDNSLRDNEARLQLIQLGLGEPSNQEALVSLTPGQAMSLVERIIRILEPSGAVERKQLENIEYKLRKSANKFLKSLQA